MNTKDILKKFEELTQYYLAELEHYSLEQFTQKPSEEDWSLGQMYNHLTQSSFFLLNMLESGPSVTEGEKTDLGNKLFAAGEFGPIRIKLPDDPKFIPATPNNKEEVRQQFQLLLEKMRETEAKLSSIPTDHKVKHPAFGYLNANEWFQLVYMHLRHHLQQKSRLDQIILT